MRTAPGAQELAGHLDDALVAQRPIVRLVHEVGLLDAPQLGLLRGVVRLQVEHVGMLGGLTRPLDEVVGDPLQLGHLLVRQDPFHRDVAALVILVDLRLRQVPRQFPCQPLCLHGQLHTARPIIPLRRPAGESCRRAFACAASATYIARTVAAPAPAPSPAVDVASQSPKAPSPKAPTAAEFPGCAPVRLPREELDDCELRFEYWDAVSETAWVCEPASPCHESPSRCLTGLVTLIACVRGAPIRCFGSMDLLQRDRRDEPQVIMQADESVYLHPGRARLPGAKAMILRALAKIKWSNQVADN